MNTGQILKVHTGSATSASSTTVTLGLDDLSNPWQTTAGSTVIVVASTIGGTALQMTAFTARDTGVSDRGIWRKTNVAAGETSWTISTFSGTFTEMVWVAMEFAAGAMDDVAPVDVAHGSSNFATSGNTMTLSMPVNFAYQGMTIANFTSTNTAGSPVTWSSFPADCEEVIEVTGSTLSMAVVTRQYYTTATDSIVGTASGSITGVATAGFTATGVDYAEPGAKRAADLRWACGFEFGPVPAGSLVTSGAGGTTGAAFTSTAGTPAVIAGGRSGDYQLEISASAAIEYVEKQGVTATSGKVVKLNIYFPTSLPAGNLDLALIRDNTLSANTAYDMTLFYRSASQKIGVRLGTAGTEMMSDTTVVANQWIGVSLRPEATGSSGNWTNSILWQVDYNAAQGDTTGFVEQTPASTAAMASQLGSGDQVWVRLGWSTAQTGTVRYDDVMISGQKGAHPLGDLRCLPLLVDSTTGPTVTGTVGNFALITNNATGTTLAAGNLATARANLRDRTYGASQAGVCQITTAASDRLTFPLTYLDPATIPGSFRGISFYTVGWAASTTAADLGGGIAAATGLAEEYIFIGNPGFSNSTTAQPLEVLWKSQSQAGQALSTFKMFVGNSNDAAPDIGVLLLMGEAVYAAAAPVVTHRIGPNDEWTATAYIDADSSAVIRYAIASTDLTRGCTLKYSISGVAQTDLVCAANSTAQVNISAASFTDLVTELVPAA